MSHESVEVLKLRLAACKGRWPDIARLADVPIKTLRKVAQGYTKNPRVQTFERINAALDKDLLTPR